MDEQSGREAEGRDVLERKAEPSFVSRALVRVVDDSACDGVESGIVHQESKGDSEYLFYFCQQRTQIFLRWHVLHTSISGHADR